MVMAKRNYKCYAELGLHPYLLTRKLTVLDTGAGPNFIREDELPSGYAEQLKNGPVPSVCDANRNPVRIKGTVDLLVRMGEHLARVKFNVCERLAAGVVLGCDYLDRFVEAIYPRRKTVELVNGQTVPIVRRPLARPPTQPPLPASQEYGKEGGRTTPKVRVATPVKLEPGTQTFVTVTTKRHGLMVLQPSEKLYQTNQVIASNGVVQVEPDKPFRILLANFGQAPYTLCKGQVVGTLLPHPTALIPTRMQWNDLLGLTEEEATRHFVVEPTPGEETNKENTLEVKCANDLDLSHVEPRYRERLRTILRKYDTLWSGELGEISATEHRIQLLPGTRPISQQPYRAGPNAREFVAKEVDRMLRAGVVEPSDSPWASPVVLAPKKDGSLRFCIDYRRLNAVTKRDSYPLPRMDEYIDSLGEANVFTTLDANSGYWQVPVAREDRSKTAFVCHSGLYQFLRMPFGLKNAPATFQRTLDVVLSPFKWKSCLVYLDDVIIFSKDEESHLRHLDEVLHALQLAGVTLKLAKCNFFTDTVHYLGHVIRPGTLSIDEVVTKALREVAIPTTQTELRSFLGLCNVYRRFVRNYTDIAAPLNRLLRKGQPVKLEPFGEPETQAFKTLIAAVTSPPILALPKLGLPYSLDTDASNEQVGAALFQEEDGERRPIGFWSRTLHAAERNYATPEKECLAVVWGVTTLRPYLQGVRFTVHTDHSALRWLLEISDPSGRLMRWKLRLGEFDFQVKYKKGKLNTQADALSRLPTTGVTTVDFDEEIPCFLSETLERDQPDFLDDLDALGYAENDALLAAGSYSPDENLLTPINREELLRHQLADDFCTHIRTRINRGDDIPFETDDSGVLIRTVHAHPQVVVPHDLKSRVLHMGHHSKLAGHPGGRKMYYTLSRDYYWPALAVDAYATVRNCVRCAQERVKLVRKTKRLKLFPAQAPLESVSIDILGELIRTPRGHRWLLVITDRFSKLVRTVPLRRITAAEIAKAFVHHWVFVYGPPLSVLADNGQQFVAKLFQATCKILGISNVFTTTYHPQTNGQAERFNRTILKALRHYVAEHPKDWDIFTDALTYAYNTQTHSATKLSPFELVLSRPPRALSLHREPQVEEIGTAQYHTKWQSWLKSLMNTARTEMRKSQLRYKANYDKTIRSTAADYSPGRYVFVRRDYANPRENTRHKLAPVATGPYRIVTSDADTIVIQDGDRHERITRDRVTPAPSPAGIPTPSSGATNSNAPSLTDAEVPTPIRPSAAFKTALEPTAHRGLSDLPSDAPLSGGSVTGIWRRQTPQAGRTSQHGQRSGNLNGTQPVSTPSQGCTTLGRTTPTAVITQNHPGDVTDKTTRPTGETTTLEVPSQHPRAHVPNDHLNTPPSGETIISTRPQADSDDANLRPGGDANAPEALVQPPRTSGPTTTNTPRIAATVPSSAAGSATSKRPQRRPSGENFAPTAPRNPQRAIDPQWLSELHPNGDTLTSRTNVPDGVRTRSQAAATRRRADPSTVLSEKERAPVPRTPFKVHPRGEITSDLTTNPNPNVLATPIRSSVPTPTASRHVTFRHADVARNSQSCADRRPKPPPATVTRPSASTTSHSDDLTRSSTDKPDLYVVDKIVSHRYDDKGNILYQVRWFGYSPEEDTEEPARHLRRSHLLRYYKRRKLRLPEDIGDAMEG